MAFPDIQVGVCPVCGGTGGDYPASSLTSADSASNLDTAGGSLPLVEYQGELMCEVCKQNRINRDTDLRNAEAHAEEERFRQQVGFKKTAA